MEENKDIKSKVVVNQLSFWGFVDKRYSTWKAGRNKSPITKEALEESAKVKALSRALKGVEAINEKLYNQIEELTEHIGSKTTSVEEKLLDGVIKMFTAKPPISAVNEVPPKSNLEKQKVLDTGIEKTDTEIKEFLSNSSTAEKELLKSMPVSEISKHLNSNGTQISEKTIIRAKEILKNGAKQ